MEPPDMTKITSDMISGIQIRITIYVYPHSRFILKDKTLFYIALLEKTPKNYRGAPDGLYTCLVTSEGRYSGWEL